MTLPLRRSRSNLKQFSAMILSIVNRVERRARVCLRNQNQPVVSINSTVHYFVLILLTPWNFDKDIAGVNIKEVTSRNWNIDLLRFPKSVKADRP